MTKHTPKRPDPVAVLAEAQRLMDGQMLAESVAVLERLPGNPDCDYRRAGLLLVLNRPAEAETLYRAILTRAPGHVDTMVGLAGSLVAQGRPQEALALLEPAVRAQPNSGRIAYLAGVALDEAGHALAAAAQLAKARALVIAPAERRKLVPYEIYVQLSRRCNLHCTMCGWEIWKDNSGFMEWPVFERVIAEA
ncbi:MAG: tetratricopeptide repeat protein, partial [Magnetospirillum sp.]